jgi:hypothetical protein
LDAPSTRPDGRLLHTLDWGIPSRRIHHNAHWICNDRVRAGWVPCAESFLYAAKVLGKQIEEQGECFGPFRRKPAMAPLRWLRVDDAKDVRDEVRREPFAVLPKQLPLAEGDPGCVVERIQRILRAAKTCRAGTPWWAAWILAGLEKDARDAGQLACMHVQTTGRLTP